MGVPISFSSNPLALAGLDQTPQSTLDQPNVDSSSSGILQSISSIVGSVSSVVLGGLAISKLPNANTPGLTTQIQQRAGGVTVSSTPSLLGSSVGGINISTILMLLVIGAIIWYVAKKV